MTTRTPKAIPGNRRGFTLLEVLIIALVISILSGIAVFSIQTFVDEQKRKAVIGEVRQLSQAYSFAHNDIGFYPKMCFLTANRLSPLLSQVNGTGQVVAFHRDFQVYGANYQMLQPAPADWNGPYMGLSANRAGSVQGRGGLTQVDLTTDPNVAPGNIQEWPADAWGNPYVLYAMKWVLPGGATPYEARFISADNPNNFSEAPNATLAIVSYGPNRVPGMPPDTDQSDPRRALRIYREVPATTPVRYEMLNTTDLNANPALAQVFLGNPDGRGPGIRQVGSDDIVFEF